jgi:hypothetical protein
MASNPQCKCGHPDNEHMVLTGPCGRCQCQRFELLSSKERNPLASNLDILRNIVSFAYEMGYHELGYDIVSELESQLRGAAEMPAHHPLCRSLVKQPCSCDAEGLRPAGETPAPQSPNPRFTVDELDIVVTGLELAERYAPADPDTQSALSKARTARMERATRYVTGNPSAVKTSRDPDEHGPAMLDDL